MTTTDKPALLTKVLSEGMILGAISSFIYLLTFVYEAGYCFHFGIPLYLITPNLTTVFVAAAGVSLVLITAWPILGLITPLIRRGFLPEKHQRPFQKIFAINALALATTLILLTAYGGSIKGVIWLVIVILAINIVYFGPALIPQKNGKTLGERLEEWNTHPQTSQIDITDLILERGGRKYLVIALCIAAVLGFTFAFGDAKGSTQKTFPILKNPDNYLLPKEYVLLRSYPEIFIAVELDRKEKKVKSGILLIKNSSVTTLALDLETVGPLESPKYP
ncbi:hypothetical protein [Collimonas humicola]|uniref:hypothetical protein n=1 Tax=Collimonas humicola TaxID=2825886 RepID=UPI001B8B81BE|nr:hypothetical protein [Collimonas humicola]